MGKFRPAKRHNAQAKPAGDAATPATLKDLLRPEVVAKLKESAAAMQAEEEKRQEAERQRAEAARLAEQKRLDNDFGYLLEQSMGKTNATPRKK